MIIRHDNLLSADRIPVPDNIDFPLSRDIPDQDIAAGPPGAAGRLFKRLSLLNDIGNKEKAGDQDKIRNFIILRIRQHKERRVCIAFNPFDGR